jgi:hypothetical protein
MRVWICTPFGVVSEQVLMANQFRTFIKGNFTVPAPPVKTFPAASAPLFRLPPPGCCLITGLIRSRAVLEEPGKTEAGTELRF